MHINGIGKLFCIAIIGCGILAGTADARHRGRRHYRGYRTRSNSQSVLARLYAEQLRAAAIRDAAVRAARAESNRATTALYLAQIRLEREYKLSAGASSAANRLQAAQQELEAIHEAAINELLKTPAYATAVTAKNAAIARLGELKESNSSSPQWLSAVAARTEAALLVSRLEMAAFKTDESVRAATQRVDAALAEVKADRRRFEATIRGDANVVMASSDLVEAKKQVARAYSAGNKSLAATNRGRASSRTVRPSR